MEPAKRLGSEAEGKTWVDGVAAAYAQRAGITLSSGSAGGAGGGASGGAVINSEEFNKFQAEQEQLAAQHIELYMRYLKKDSRAGEIRADVEKANAASLQDKLDSITREHGDAHIDGTQPCFDALRPATSTRHGTGCARTRSSHFTISYSGVSRPWTARSLLAVSRS